MQMKADHKRKCIDRKKKISNTFISYKWSGFYVRIKKIKKKKMENDGYMERTVDSG